MEPDSTAQQQISPSSLRRRSLRFVRRFFVPLFLLIAVVWTFGFYELGRAAVFRAHPELAGQQQASLILQKVGALIQLPTNESPTMATINDAASAKQAQPFLANAQNGDVLIVYTNAQTALLYRPSTDKLIAVGPVNATAGGQAAAAASQTSEPAATSTLNANATTTKPKAK